MLKERYIKRAPRVDLSHPALLATADGLTMAVTVTDISGGGFRVESDGFLRIGEYVSLRVEGYGEFPAQIRWALGAEAGGIFLEPVILPSDQTNSAGDLTGSG